MAKKANHIIPECYVDTNILKTLLRVDGVNHQFGCNQVMSKLKNGKYSDSFVIGIIDDDKKKTYDYSDFETLSQSSHLRLMKHKTRSHYLIFVCKAAEDFLLSCATELSLNLSDYDLPLTLEGLKEVTKNCESDRDPRIKKLVNAVRPSSEMARLERTIRYLQEKQYDVNVEELITVFRA